MGIVLSRTEVEALLPGFGETSPGVGVGSRPVESEDSLRWPVSTLRRLELRLESSSAELTEVIGELSVSALFSNGVLQINSADDNGPDTIEVG
ncbi:MAG: hypothetical protein VB861_11945, partial [Planctomycetaceae bacterium]